VNVEVNGNGKRSSLLRWGKNYSRKKFYSAGFWSEKEKLALKTGAIIVIQKL
jgi:hypothetical protein